MEGMTFQQIPKHKRNRPVRGWKVFLAESVAYGNAQTQENVKDIQDGWNVAHLGGESGDGPRAG